MQLDWASLAAGPHVVTVGHATASVTGDGGAVTVVLDGLPSAATLPVTVDGVPVGTARTLAPPPGPELCRIATLSDLHIGGPRFGLLPAARDDGDPADPPPERCLRAALAEIRAWGASLLVVKGDITDHGFPDEWARAASLLAASGLPVVSTIGNHDVQRDAVDGRPAMAAAGIDLVVDATAVRDLPGLRLVVSDSTIRGRNHGSMARRADDLLDAAAGADRPVLVAQHHQVQRHRFPTHWPPGVAGPSGEALLHDLARANAASVLTSGHTHRCRARRIGPVLLTEVGAPKDYPGVWAGYVVHEGGIRQVVRRVAAPAVLRWTESTGRTFLGTWAKWSPGRLDDRCVRHLWARGRDSGQ